MEFGLQIDEISFFVFNKLELVIYKTVHDITENLRFAFLYVLSIEVFLLQNSFNYYYKRKNQIQISSRVHLNMQYRHVD